MTEVKSRRLSTHAGVVCVRSQNMAVKAVTAEGFTPGRWLREGVKNHPALGSCSLVKDSYASIPAPPPKCAPGRRAKQTCRWRVHSGSRERTTLTFAESPSPPLYGRRTSSDALAALLSPLIFSRSLVPCMLCSCLK